MTMTDVDEYITHPAVIPKLDEATTVAIRYIRMEMEIRPCVSGCESWEDLNDFTEANLYLMEAFERVVGREPVLGFETDITFLNELARRLDVWLSVRPIGVTPQIAKRLVYGVKSGTADWTTITDLVHAVENGFLPKFLRERQDIFD